MTSVITFLRSLWAQSNINFFLRLVVQQRRVEGGEWHAAQGHRSASNLSYCISLVWHIVKKTIWKLINRTHWCSRNNYWALCPLHSLGGSGELWSPGPHISHQVEKVQQRLYLLRKLKHAHIHHHLLAKFHWSTLETLLTRCCTLWSTSCAGENRKDLQVVVRAAEESQYIGFHLSWTAPVLPPTAL